MRDIQFLTSVVEWPRAPMPQWMVDIVLFESKEGEVEPPSHLYTKFVSGEIASKLRGVFGYTIHSAEGELCIVYRSGEECGTEDEKQTLLHEIAHWKVKDFSSGSHTAKFYAELFRLCLYYNIDLELLFKDYDYPQYGGRNVFVGIEQFQERMELHG